MAPKTDRAESSRAADEAPAPPAAALRANSGDRSRRRELCIAGAIFAAAVLVRLVYLYDVSDSPTFTTPIVDSATYHEAGEALAEKHYLKHTFFWQPFFYPLFLGAVYFLAGPPPWIARVLQLLLGGVTCLLTYRLGRKLFGAAAGIVAAAMAAVYMPLVYFEAELLATGWAAFWTVALLLLFLDAAEKTSAWSCARLGAAAGLAVLTRPTFLPFLIAGLLWLVVVLMRSRRRFRALATALPAAALAFCLITMPVALENYRRNRRFTFLPRSGGINLYIGNNPDVAETLNTRPGYQWARILELPEQDGVRKQSWQKSRWYYGRVWQFAREQPRAFLANMASKGLQFASSRELPRNSDMYVHHNWSWLLAVGAWKAGPFGFPFGVVLPLAVVGAIFARRRIPPILWLFLVLYSAAVIVVFVTARYRMPIVPAVLAVAAAGAVAIVQLARSRRWISLLAAAAASAATVLLATLPGPFCTETLHYEAEMYNLMGSEMYKHDRLEQAAALYRRSLGLAPGVADVHYNLGATLARHGKLGEGMRSVRRALELQHDHYGAHYEMGNIQAKLSDYAGAERSFRAALKIKPHSATFHFALANALRAQGRNAKAIEQLRAAVALRPDAPELLTGLAFVLSTVPEAPLRDGRQALALAEQACRQTRWNQPVALDALAAAYAELGQFEKAVETAERARALAFEAANIELADRLAQRLSRYRSRRPWRE